MEVRVDGQDGNVTQALLYHLVDQARQVRLRSWCVSVVVVSHDPAFLTAFAESSLKGRLLVWATRLLVITSLTLPQLHALLPAHWTFSMMNTIFLNLDNRSSILRCGVYTHLPYSHAGARVVRLASWTAQRGLSLVSHIPLFPHKFSNFYGATIPVTAMPFLPYWGEVEDVVSHNGSLVKRYTGSDYHLLETVATALNFSFRVLPCSSWSEVVDLVAKRTSFIASLYYILLPQRQEQYDFTFTYEYAYFSFTMAKPSLGPQWQNLYYPLTDQVWAAVVAALLLVVIFFFVVIRVGQRRDGGSRLGAGSVVQDMAGMLLGQNLPRRLPNTSSSRLLVAAWLVFAFIIGTVYRGNLTAHLTLPKYPPRPETLQEMVAAADRVTMPPYGADQQKFFRQSNSQVFKTLAEIMLISPTAMEGLQQTTEKKQAHMGGRRFLQQKVAENFTTPDGSTSLYVGRESIFPGPSGWPIPHDAPYKQQLDRYIIAAVEAGLYEKWSDDMLTQTRRESQRRQREYLAQQQQQQQQGTGGGTQSGNSMTALTLTHMQGPLMLLLLGLALAGLTFLAEMVPGSCLPSSQC
ncbi:ionotropic receptor 93a-like [Panulirus ornatus]|uniref:ionotropic receptor 93a-like n=1 Tax=Panulirus ornatus TaxID=150431 RepID=UPI003A8C1C6E